MAGTTSVPAITFTSVGLTLPTEAQILAGVQTDQNAAFGGNLNPALETPQGQLATSQTAIIADKNAQFAFFVNQIDPATSTGFMQDAIGRLYFLDRLPATSTTVNCICLGLTGVIIPTGSLAKDGQGNIYASTAPGTIPAGGSVTIPFAAVNTGPIACPAGAIVGIYKAVTGWDSVGNAVDGVTGTDVESRADFEYRRQLSVAKNANGTLAAVYANLINVPGVTDLYCTDNDTDSPVTIDGITLLAHSFYAAVVGGTDLAVATAIFNKLDVGCNMNGNTSVVVADNSGYNIPVPTYNIKFQRPADLQIYFAITVQNLSGQPNSIVATQIQNAVIAAFGGADGGQRARIGSTIYATRYFLPVSLAAALAILSIYVGVAPAPVTISQYVGIGSSPKLQAANIAVTFV